jgi:hypothetical protein
MATIPRQDINRARALFQRQFHKEATPEAGRLIRILLDSIIEDPDPRWHQTQIQMDVAARRAVKDLPNILQEIAEHERTNIVRAANVLHWLGVSVPQRLKTLGFAFDKE